MTAEESDEARDLAEAAAWRVHLTEIGADTTEEFEAWLAANPHHQAAWARVEAPWDFVGRHAADPALLAARSAALRPGPRFGRDPEKKHPVRVWAAAAFGVLLAALSVVVWLRQPLTYQTASGERRTLTLADGSRLTLDSESAVEVDYRASERDLKVLRGQAQFEVAHDPSRPFRVTAGDATIVATGTNFDVDLLGYRLLVTLLEGRVGVDVGGAHLVLRPGQQMAVAKGQVPVVTVVDLASVLAWESGHVVFHNATLADAVAEMNRYDPIKFVLADRRLGGVRLSGTFKTGDTVAFADLLTGYFGIRADTSHPGVVVLSR